MSKNVCVCGKEVEGRRICGPCRSRAYRGRKKTAGEFVLDITEDVPPAVSAAAEFDAKLREKKDSATTRAVLEENARLRKALEELRHLERRAPAVIEAPADEKATAVPLVLASDWHVEERVDPGKIHGINAYDLDVARRRSHAFFQNSLRLIDLAAKDSTINTAVFALLGDFFSNGIHEELLEVNELGPGPAAGFARNLLADGVHYLLKHSSYAFRFYCVAGNHGRMTKKTRIATNSDNSLETFMYHFLAAEFAGNPRVTFAIAEGDMLYARIFDDYTVRLVHGDQVTYGGGVGGITIPIRKRLAGWDRAQRAELTCLGHFHQRLDGGDFLANGSLIGYNAYAQRFGFSPEPPAQQFALIHRRRGKSLVAPVWVD